MPSLGRTRLCVCQRQVARGETEVRLAGVATSVHLPRLSRALEELPPADVLHRAVGALAHMDHTCAEWLTVCAAGGPLGRTLGRRSAALG